MLAAHSFCVIVVDLIDYDVRSSSRCGAPSSLDIKTTCTVWFARCRFAPVNLSRKYASLS